MECPPGTHPSCAQTIQIAPNPCAWRRHRPGWGEAWPRAPAGPAGCVPTAGMTAPGTTTWTLTGWGPARTGRAAPPAPPMGPDPARRPPAPSRQPRAWALGDRRAGRQASGSHGPNPSHSRTSAGAQGEKNVRQRLGSLKDVRQRLESGWRQPCSSRGAWNATARHAIRRADRPQER